LKNKLINICYRFQNLFWGMLFPLGFAPFHLSGLLYISLLGFFYQLHKSNRPLFDGSLFGTGLGLVGLSWVYVSIHEYGHLHPIPSLAITLLFIVFLSFFYGIFAWLSKQLCKTRSVLFPWVIAACWCALEYLRSQLFGGFPWLLLGFSAHGTSLEKLLPWLGIYGPSFAITLAIGLFAQLLHHNQHKIIFSCLGVIIFLSPSLLPIQSNQNASSIKIAIIQGNVAIQDKWNEEYFWNQLRTYYQEILKLAAPNRLIVLPEAAISIPSSYIHRELEQLDTEAKLKNTGLLIGIPEATLKNSTHFYNALIGLGKAQGKYYKQQLVLFGEEIPKIWHPLFNFLHIPLVTTIPGSHHQKPIQVFKHPIASLICYEVAYPEILRRQLPISEWIVSISDDGWFGHSFAMYQHLEMAQTISFMSQRWQLFVNNNGLSSLINQNGQIIKQLPTWKTAHLTGQIASSQTLVPWMSWGDKPIMLLCLFIFGLAFTSKLLYKIKTIKSPTTLSET